MISFLSVSANTGAPRCQGIGNGGKIFLAQFFFLQRKMKRIMKLPSEAFSKNLIAVHGSNGKIFSFA
jgi:hypothetical protein